MNYCNEYDKLVITTTDTVLGLGGPVLDEIKNLIYKLKKRDVNKKLIILVGSFEQARHFVEWNDVAEEYAKKYWPGATTLVVNDQGFRMPNQPKLLDYLKEKGPMYMTSCNISNTEVCKTLAEAKKIFPQIKNVFNFGNMSQNPSQIIRVENGDILRKG